MATSKTETSNPSHIKEVIRKLMEDARESDDERRFHGRTLFLKPVVLRMGTDFNERQSCFTRDLSNTGIGFLHTFPIAPQEVLLSTQLLNGEFVQLSVYILWCIPCGEGWFISGGAFDLVDDEPNEDGVVTGYT